MQQDRAAGATAPGPNLLFELSCLELELPALAAVIAEVFLVAASADPVPRASSAVSLVFDAPVVFSPTPLEFA